jgi:hypothetical protein
MDGRRLVAGLTVLVGSMSLLAGNAWAGQRAQGAVGGPEETSTTCAIHSLPGLMRQGELKSTGSIGDIIQVECNPATVIAGSAVEVEDSQLFSRCGGKVTWLDPNEFATNKIKVGTGRSITVEVDGEGNANLALVAGPNCSIGGTVVAAHTESNKTIVSFSTGFAVEPAKVTAPGATVMPASEVEDEASSSVVTLVQAEMPLSEEKVRIAAPELASACELAPHILWLRPSGEIVLGKELALGTAIEPKGKESLRTDNDGNAFVIAIGAASCQPGMHHFEVDAEEGGFETFEPAFTVMPPQETPPF